MASTKMQCLFSFAGCKSEFDSSDQLTAHMAKSNKEHLALLGTATSKLSQIVKIQQDMLTTNLQLQKEEFEKQLAEKDAVILDLIRNQKSLSQLDPMILGIMPFDIHFSNYKEIKAKNELMDSPPFYTHPGGYKLNLRVRPNGFLSGKGKYLSLWFNSLKSDYDAVLRFPVKFTVTVQLLNQHSDPNHVIEDEGHVTSEVKCEVTPEKAGTWRYIGAEWELVEHGGMELDSENGTQYLKNDCIRFRILRIVLQ